MGYFRSSLSGLWDPCSSSFNLTSTTTCGRLEGAVAQNAGFKAVPDSQLLASCGEQAFLLLTHNVNTVPKHAFERVKAGQPMPGVIIVPDSLEIRAETADLALVVECAQPTRCKTSCFICSDANDPSDERRERLRFFLAIECHSFRSTALERQTEAT